MVEVSKFTNALANLKKPSPAASAAATVEEQAPTPPAVTRIAKAPAVVERGKGRPPGKRSDPAYEPTTVLLRKDTKRASNRKLEDLGEKADLSVLIQRLLEEWTAKS